VKWSGIAGFLEWREWPGRLFWSEKFSKIVYKLQLSFFII